MDGAHLRFKCTLWWCRTATALLKISLLLLLPLCITKGNNTVWPVSHLMPKMWTRRHPGGCDHIETPEPHVEAEQQFILRHMLSTRKLGLELKQKCNLCNRQHIYSKIKIALNQRKQQLSITLQKESFATGQCIQAKMGKSCYCTKNTEQSMLHKCSPKSWKISAMRGRNHEREKAWCPFVQVEEMTISDISLTLKDLGKKQSVPCRTLPSTPNHRTSFKHV